MKKIKVDSKAVIRDLALRVKANEEAVKSFLSRAGIECGTIRLEDLQQLQKINPDAFNEMVVYLYGEKAGADATTYDFVGGLIGSVVGTAGRASAATVVSCAWCGCCNRRCRSYYCNAWWFVTCDGS